MENRLLSLTYSWQMRIVLGIIIYGILFLSAHALSPFLQDFLKVEITNVQWISLAALLSFWTLFVLLLSRFFLGKSFPVEWKKLYMYMGMMALVGPIGEIFINSFYRFFFDSSLWTYLVFPVHYGDTSKFSFFLWSLYGLYLYFLHQKLPLNFEQKGYYFVPAFIMAFDAIVLEFLLNISSILFLSTLIFYYFPSDVLHLTTLAATPFYFLGGIVIVRTIRRFSHDPQFFGTMSFLIAGTFVFLAN